VVAQEAPPGRGGDFGSPGPSIVQLWPG
jgi:hypothetical protein